MPRFKADRPRWVTLKLSDREKEALEKLAREQGLSQQGVLRQALRVYQMSLQPLNLGPKPPPEDWG